MRVPVSWLKEYVELGDDVRELAEKLTFCGIEVEGIETRGVSCRGVVVGEVRAVDRHPQADRLTVCRVFDGTQDLQVVCGAPNVKAGGKYPLARIGVSLPGGLTIKKAKLRGVESHGMLCAEDELGLSKNHAGLMDLPPDSVPGADLADLLGAPETVLDLEITPNRPDCLGILGIAREVAALYGRPLKTPDLALDETGPDIAGSVKVVIEDPENCPRYTARLLKGATLAPSPDWMRRRLELAGVRPINNLVDVTNYVMLEYGHPLHAFDFRRIREGTIVVRQIRPGETMRTLDDVDRDLPPDSLVIADASVPVAVAGVMGGKDSEIADDTSTVLLESACFRPASIRRTSKRLGLTTESSYRFARGTDPVTAELASRRAAMLMKQLAGGELCRGLVDAYPRPLAVRTVGCRWETLRRRLGRPVDPGQALAIFGRLEFGVVRHDEAGCELAVPPFRRDVAIEEDLVEEFARMDGLDRIPAQSEATRCAVDRADADRRLLDRALDRLAGLGLQEIMNYSLVSDRLLNLFDPSDAPARIRLPNPLSEDQVVLRTSLIPQMVETLGRNRSRQVAEAALFESGRVYARAADGSHRETARVCIGLMGAAGRTALQKRPPASAQEAFLWMKGIVSALFQTSVRQTPDLAAADAPWAEKGQCMRLILNGEDVGVMGVVRRPLAEEWRIYEPVVAAEFDAAHLLRPPTREPVFAPPSYPAVQRDNAFVVDKTVRDADIQAVIRRVAPAELESLQLFDVFDGKALGAGKKSLAYSFTYRCRDRTLTEDEVERLHGVIVEAIARETGAVVRAG